MKNLKVNKVIVLLTIVLAVILGLTVSSFADDNIQIINPSDVIGNSSSSGSSSNANTNTGANSNTNANVNNTNRINNVNTSSSSSYNNTNLPSTGLEDHTPLFLIVGLLAVVAIVAYKKANYYKGI